MTLTKKIPKTCIKPEILARVRRNRRLKLALMDLLEINERSLFRYFERNDPALTRWDSLQLIAIYLKEEPENCVDANDLNKYLS